MGNHLKNLENFWYHNKSIVLVVIFFIFAIVIMIVMSPAKVKPDVEIAYVTDGINLVSEDAINHLNQFFAPVIQDVNHDNKKVTAIIPMQGPRIEMEFYGEGSQIVLLDVGTFQNFVTRGVFVPLDNYVEKYGIDLSKYPEISSKTELDDKIHTYAIPMEYIRTLIDKGFPNYNYYLIIRATRNQNPLTKAKNKNAASILDILLQQKTH